METTKNSRLGLLFLKAVEIYTGRNAKSVKFVEDPRVDDTWALRAEMSDGQAHDFLVVFGHSNTTSRSASAEEIAEVLEDCVYNEWPPKAGRLRFL